MSLKAKSKIFDNHNNFYLNVLNQELQKVALLKREEIFDLEVFGQLLL